MIPALQHRTGGALFHLWEVVVGICSIPVVPCAFPAVAFSLCASVSSRVHWYCEVDDRSERYHTRRIDGSVALVVVAPDVAEVNRLRNVGQVVDITGKAPERR